MQLIPVTDTNTAAAFLQVAVQLYHNHPNWIRPLDKDINDVFDKKRNKAFRTGDAVRWVLKDDSGVLIGRIAAFTNNKYKNKGDDIPVGGIGFFECINNQQAANLLFDTAKQWLQQKGMQAMDGPINFGERDRWWGLVTEGFIPPLYGMNYNHSYYQHLFEQYGFRLFFNQLCFFVDPKAPISPKISERHKQVAANKDFTFCTLKKKQLEKFALDFATVYNKAWAGHGGLKQLAPEQAKLLFKKMEPVIDERIVYFVYHQNKPVAVFLNLPDLNQYFKHFNGKFGLLQKLYFLYLKNFKPAKKFTGLVFGVIPECQGKGLDAYLIGEASKILRSNASPYTDFEMQWIGDFNPKMLNVAQSLGEVSQSRQLSTWRYLFDSSKAFNRHPILI
ncbi:MAG TPA: hypothetical protein PKC39_07860 [Ferruginibacter sp.]|nr:hypothetical protein [Ferruginibacter sp.]HMP20858.1 hypothetical protein [Ferruginibacter sp.]